MAANKPETFSTQQLEQLIENLENEAGVLRGVKTQMEKNSVESVDVRYAIEMRKGVKKIIAFAAAAKEAVNERIFSPSSSTREP